MVEGTPLLREHTLKKCIEGSNPSLSAKSQFVSFSLIQLYPSDDAHIDMDVVGQQRFSGRVGRSPSITNLCACCSVIVFL